MSHLLPKVLNKRVHGVPAGAVYVGRPSKWGNPYAIGRDGDRSDVIRKYEALLARKLEKDPEALARLRAELRGKDLVCWCAPYACHADVLLKLANGD